MCGTSCVELRGQRRRRSAVQAPFCAARTSHTVGLVRIGDLASALALLGVTWLAACGAGPSRFDDRQRAAIADTLRRTITSAYDFRQPNVVARLMGLYSDSGRVVSAAAGRVTTTRGALRGELEHFWQYVGVNMRDPVWTWGETYVDVLSPDAAVMTATYRIAHRTPEGAPHTVGGAWTALWVRRNGKWTIVQEHLSDAPAGTP